MELYLHIWYACHIIYLQNTKNIIYFYKRRQDLARARNFTKTEDHNLTHTISLPQGRELRQVCERDPVSRSPGREIPSLAETNKHICVYPKHNDNLRRDLYNFRSILTTGPAAFRSIKKIQKRLSDG